MKDIETNENSLTKVSGFLAKSNKKREYLPTLADLIDILTINQIKEIKFQDKLAYAEVIKKICGDIDLIIGEKNVKLSSKLVRIIILVAQLNLFIWETKDKMQEVDAESYSKLLKFCHQLNGIRNTMKNKILEEIGDKDPSKKRTNTGTDGLKGWDISVD